VVVIPRASVRRQTAVGSPEQAAVPVSGVAQAAPVLELV
jgi:hypothetical protein